MNAREDTVLLAMFEAEVETHMAALSEGLIALEQDPSQSQWYEPLMRAAHCIKGASDLFDLKDAVRVSHVIEDTFTSAREGRLAMTPPLVDVLFTGVDLLGRVTRMDDLAGDQAENIHQLLQEIDQIARGESSEASLPPKPRPLKETGADPIVHPLALDSAWVDAVHQRVGDWLASGTEDLKINLGRVDRIDAVGLALLSIASSESGDHRCLVLNEVPPQLQALLSAYGISSLNLEHRN